jgi:muramoyltetrapeptide carboxypeptidase
MPGIKLLKSLGYYVAEAEHLWGSHHQFAATDRDRTSDLQKMVDDQRIKAIICSRGGYGSLRTLLPIDWSVFRKNPKWIVGFSDITVIHSALNKMGIASMHGAMPRYFADEERPSMSFMSLLDALENKPVEYSFGAHQQNRCGKAQAQLVGGNLSILYSLRGTPFDLDVKGKILFVEDLNEYLYHIDRIMMNLKFGGVLSQLAGLVVGSFTAMKDHETPFGMNVEEIIRNAVDEYGYPVAFGLPAGHQKDNMALPLGRKATLVVSEGGSELNFGQES